MAAERQQDVQPDPWWGEHVHRYEEASRLIGDTDTVLDVACGFGFGTSILAAATSGVVHGCDLAADAVLEAHRKHAGARARFWIASGTQLPVRDAHFDAVVSFETVEHVADDEGFLAELWRVLRPGGSLVLSTPNALVSSPSGCVTNPFHVREYRLRDLRALLGRRFTTVRVRGQRFTRFSSGRSGGALGRWAESALYLRGPRKLPLPIRDRISMVFTGGPHYPRPSDYDLVDAQEDVLKCKTFFSVCRK
jgi:SAM-dependent methyltransferase